MPHKPRRANPNHTVHLTIPIPGDLKNRLIDAATTTGEGIATYTQRAILNQIRADRAQPPIPAHPTTINPLQPVINYLTGTRTLQPCGQTTCNQQPEKLNGKTYCGTCTIQLT